MFYRIVIYQWLCECGMGARREFKVYENEEVPILSDPPEFWVKFGGNPPKHLCPNCVEKRVKNE